MGKSRSGVVLVASSFALLNGALLLTECSSSEDTPQVAAKCQLNSDCNNPLSCTFGRCHQTCVATRDCPAPQHCVKTELGNVCQLEDESSCLYASQCQPPLKCAVDSKCRNACLSDIDCITGQHCADGSCAEPTEVGADGHLKNAKDGGLTSDDGDVRNDGSSLGDTSSQGNTDAPLESSSGPDVSTERTRRSLRRRRHRGERD